MNEDQAKFSGWGRVEVMGHQTHIGLVTTEAYGGAVLFRIDQPEIPESEETLERPEYGTGFEPIPAGAVVKRGAIPGLTVLVGSGSIYRIIPCTEEAARKAIRESERRPLMVVRLPEGKALGAPVSLDCCGGNPEDGHNLGCSVYDEDDDPDGPNSH